MMSTDENFNDVAWNLKALKMSRGNFNWQIEEERHKFLRQIEPSINDWKGRLPNLRDIFQPEEIDQLLLDSMDYMDSGQDSYTERFVGFVARTGYKDEPELDENGQPRLRRATAVHRAAKYSYFNYRGVFDALFQIYGRLEANYADDEGLTHFHAACQAGCDEVVERFLEFGQDPDCRVTATGDTALHLALANDRKTAAELLLLRGGADPNAANARGSTPLHVVCQMYGGDDLARMLFAICDCTGQSLRVDAPDELGNTPLHLALARRHRNLTELLLRRGADPNSANHEGMTPLRVICHSYRQDDDLAELFFRVSGELGQRVQVDAMDKSRSTALHLALSRGNRGTARLLLDNGADPNLPNKNRRTPLHIICMRRADDDFLDRFLEYLGERGTTLNINAQDHRGQTALHYALQDGLARVSETLLRHGANPNLTNGWGSNALHVILSSNKKEHEIVDYMRLVFDFGDETGRWIELDVRDNEGQTPLQMAVANLLLDVVDVLLERGADLKRFTFPAALRYYEGFDRDNDCWLNVKLRLASGALAIVERLERKGYQLRRDDALAVVKFFNEHNIFEESSDIAWLLDDEDFAVETRGITIASSSLLRRDDNDDDDDDDDDEDSEDGDDEATRRAEKSSVERRRVSLYDLIVLQAEVVDRLVTSSDYFELARSKQLYYLREGPCQKEAEACTVHLYEKVANGFFRRWALDAFWKLTPNRLPILCCEKIFHLLKNRDLCTICLAVADR